MTEITKTSRNFPIGCKFNPKDEEAMLFYLEPKINDEEEAYPGLIPTVDLYQYEPKNIPGFKPHEPCFYFSPRCSVRTNGSRIKRTIDGDKGVWKLCNKVNQIRDSNSVLLGRRNNLVYTVKNEVEINAKSTYMMVEYVLDESRCKNSNVNDLVLCKVYVKKPSYTSEEPLQSKQQLDLNKEPVQVEDCSITQDDRKRKHFEESPLPSSKTFRPQSDESLINISKCTNFTINVHFSPSKITTQDATN